VDLYCRRREILSPVKQATFFSLVLQIGNSTVEDEMVGDWSTDFVNVGILTLNAYNHCG